MEILVALLFVITTAQESNIVDQQAKLEEMDRFMMRLAGSQASTSARDVTVNESQQSQIDFILKQLDN